MKMKPKRNNPDIMVDEIGERINENENVAHAMRQT